MRTFFAIIACFVLVIIFCVFVLFLWQAIRGIGIFKKKSAIQLGDGSSSGGLSLIILSVAVFVIYGLSQMYAGFVGIESYAGNGYAYAALAAALFARFTLPLTVGCYYAAEHVWGWHWSLALLFAAPGLAFNLLMLPGLAANALNRFSGKSDSDALGPEKTTPDGDEPERISLSSQSISETMTEPTKYRPPSISLIPAAIPTGLSGYELLAAEKEKGYRHEALWLKCHSEAYGDQTKAESAYNRARAQILGDEFNASKSKETAQKLKAARAKVRERAASVFRVFVYILLTLVFGALTFLSAVAGVMLLKEPVDIVLSVVMIVAAFLFGLATYKCNKAAQRGSGA